MKCIGRKRLGRKGVGRKLGARHILSWEIPIPWAVSWGSFYTHLLIMIKHFKWEKKLIKVLWVQKLKEITLGYFEGSKGSSPECAHFSSNTFSSNGFWSKAFRPILLG